MTVIHVGLRKSSAAADSEAQSSAGANPVVRDRFRLVSPPLTFTARSSTATTRSPDIGQKFNFGGFARSDRPRSRPTR
jgi:hypothetical protein